MSHPDSTPPEEGPLSFDEARDRLRARGYLDRGVEGAVLKGALAARTRARGLVQGASVAVLFLALALAVSETAFLSVAGALPVWDIFVLFLWLLFGAALAASAVVLVLVLIAWLRLRTRGDADATSTELAVGFGILAGVAGALAAIPALDSAGPVAAAGILLLVAVTVFIAFRAARGVAFTVIWASGKTALASPRRRAGAVVATLALLAVAAIVFFVSRRAVPHEEPIVVEANARRIVVVAVDGWSDRYLTVATAGTGGTELPPSRPPSPAAAYRYEKTESELDPAAFWTSVATAEPARRHGVGSLDLVRVRGVRSPVRPLGGTEWYLARLLPRLGLARRESVTAAARRVPSIWEVASRAGIPSLVVGWWTTYPAGEGGGTVLSNHLFFAARAGASLAGEGWPPEAAVRAARLAPRVAPEPGTLDRLIEDAIGLDAFSIAAFRQARHGEGSRLSLVYLPGLDILGTALADPRLSSADRVAVATALTEEARKIQGFLENPALREGVDLLALFLDGGRRERMGALRLEGPLAAGGPGQMVRPIDVGPTLLAALGIPASRETEGHVVAALLRPGAVSTRSVATWGRRRGEAPIAIDPKEYVENLRSLGYLK